MLQHRTADPASSVRCPSCGQSMAPEQRCPHCGAETHRRLSLRGLRYVSLLTALVGTALVWAVARSTDVPAIRAADIRGEMNWAYVRMVGVVTRHPSYDLASGQLSFWLDDGTGEVRAIAYRPVSDRLVEAPQVPVLGDRVRIEGTLRIREDLQQLVISLPSALHIERPEPVVSFAGDLTKEYMYRRVCLRGQVRNVRIPYEGLAILSLRDATGQIDVVAEREFPAAYSMALSLEPGEQAELCGAVTSYESRLQLALDDAATVGRLAVPVEVAPQTQIAEVGRHNLGQLVRLRGKITAVTPLQAGLRLLLEDGGGEVVVVLWNDVIGEGADLGGLAEGSLVDVTGRVAEYRGLLEVVPEIRDDLSWLEPASDVARIVPLSQLGMGYLGDMVTVQARIVYSVPSPSGVRFRLRDEDAEGYLLAWRGWLDACPSAAQLVPGAWVSARGLVNLREGVVEIVPQYAEDVVVTRMEPLAEAEPTATIEAPSLVATASEVGPGQTPTEAAALIPTPTRVIYQTGAVGPDASGNQVAVEGVLVDLVLFESGQRCLIDDGSGPLALWLPKEAFAALYGEASWQFGSVVRVRGLVQVYQGEPELVPTAASDLSIIRPAPPQTAPPTRMADLRESHVGQRIVVEGEVVEVRSFSQGIAYLLDDGSGRLTLLLWQSVLDNVTERDCLAMGARVRATGRVNAYQGALELVPGVGRDVMCLP